MFRPYFWLSNEWFTPDAHSGIAIPFYLAHPRLRQLERRQMYEVEGGTERWCMRILRHEVGHALDNAYRLHFRRRYRELFGSWAAPYPKFYQPKPYSKSYVIHLDMWYAQAHPAEDFAETFAVWLRPGSGWRQRYAGWPALRKLEYVDELMAEIAGEAPAVTTRAAVAAAARSAHDPPRALREEARALRRGAARLLRQRPAPPLQRRPQVPHATRRPRASCARSSRSCGRWCRAGRASTTTRSSRSSTTSSTAARSCACASSTRRSGSRLDTIVHGHGADDELPARGQSPSGAVDVRCTCRREPAHRSHREFDVHDEEAPPNPPSPLRVLMLMDKDLVPPDDVSGLTPEQIRPVQGGAATSPPRCASSATRSACSACTTTWACIRDAIDEFKPRHRVQPARRLPRLPRLRPARRRVPRADPPALHRLQPARADAGARQGADEEDHALPPHPRPGLRRLPARPADRAARRSSPSRCWSSRVNVEGSIGIAQASIVHDDEKLAERVKYIHEALGTYAIAEQYIAGRELYVGVMGNLRLRDVPGRGSCSSRRPPRTCR